MKKVSKKQFLEELGSVWNESPARSILLARLDYEHIPAETAGIGQAMGSQFRTQQSINESVSLGLGSMGIFGGGGGGWGFGMGMPDEYLFYSSMGLIRQHEGDPPAAPALQAHAGDIVAGRVPALQAFSLAGTAIPGMGNMSGLIGSMVNLTGAGGMLTPFALIMAALAVPLDEIEELLEELED